MDFKVSIFLFNFTYFESRDFLKSDIYICNFSSTNYIFNLNQFEQEDASDYEGAKTSQPTKVFTENETATSSAGGGSSGGAIPLGPAVGSEKTYLFQGHN